MATEIKRVRFFDGQFLKELEFRDEQAYHMHLRRRMNFFLFGQSGAVALNPDDLKFINLDNVNKTFQVRAGMAICRRAADMEGKEIVLFADSPVIDLDAEGIVAGGTAFVTLNYQEVEAMDPPSEGDVSENTRVKEQAVIDVHDALPPALAPNGEEYILLGTIAYDTMVADYAARHEAKLRASLVGASPSAPSVISLTGVTSASPGGAAVAAVINGTNLAGATAVTFADPAVTAIVNSSAPATVNISVTVSGAAVPGAKAFTVTTPGGAANSPGGVVFTVTGAVPAPVVTGIDVHAGAQGTVVGAIISGTNLLGATGVAFSGAGIVAAIQPGGTAVSLPVSITIAGAAAVGARTFTVTTPGGAAGSGGVVGADFSVTAAVPPLSLISLIPNIQLSGGTIDVHGNNIRNPALAVGAPAAGTTVQMRKGADSKAAATIVVRPDVAGHQVVRVTVPNRAGTPWGVNEAVTLDLTFSGSTASLPFTYDD